MKVKFVFPSSFDATVIGITEEGEQVALESVLVQPMFSAPNAKPVVGTVDVLDMKDKLIESYSLGISGTTGKFAIQPRRAVRSLFDSKRYGQ